MSDERERMTEEQIEDLAVELKELGDADEYPPCRGNFYDAAKALTQLRADLKEVTSEAVALRMQYKSALDMVLQETGEKLNALKKLRFAESAYEDHITIKQDLAAENQRLREALEQLRDCDFVITPVDRMDAVRDIARRALTPPTPQGVSKYKRQAPPAEWHDEPSPFTPQGEGDDDE